MSFLAVAQFAPGADQAANLQTIRELAAIAVSRGAGLVVAPEYSSYFSPKKGPDWIAAAQALDGEFVTGLAEVARELGIHVVAGFAQRATEQRFFNTACAVGPAGTVVASYRKVHLYDAFGERESDWVVPGPIETPETFEWDGFTVGIQTCYDIRFPESTRRLVDSGATLVAMPAQWVPGPLKEHHWHTLVAARALENTIYFAAADHAPPAGIGNSMIVDPMGVGLAALGAETAVTVAEVTPHRLAALRELNPALALRRLGVNP